uniref:Galectin n=1 Tax=Ascaris lumbricoides TaxID=6252 RepID=A0A0M3IIV2_ASCLU
MFIPANSQIFGQLFLQIELVPTNESGDFDSSIRAPVAALGDIQLVQTTKVIEGDTMVVQFRAHRHSSGIKQSFWFEVFGEDTKDRVIHLRVSGHQIVYSARKYGGTWDEVTSKLGVLHFPVPEGHWCTFHIRVVHNRYQFFYHHKFAYEYNGVNGVFKPHMRYENGVGIRAMWNYPGMYSVNYRIPSGATNDSYFLSQPHRVRYGRVPQKLYVGQEFFLEILAGDSRLYYWNREDQTAANGWIVFLDLNDIEVLRVQIDWKKGVLRVTKPQKVYCGVFKYEKNSIIQMLVRIERDQFTASVFFFLKSYQPESLTEVEVGNVKCDAQHESDPNDIVAFVLNGNIEPLRYVVYDS